MRQVTKHEEIGNKDIFYSKRNNITLATVDNMFFKIEYTV